jgi:hypothetical protein
MANTVKSMGEVLPPKRSRAEKRAAQDDDDDFGFDDATAGTTMTKQAKICFRDARGNGVKRRPPPQQEALPSEDSDDDANDPYDDDDDDDEDGVMKT